MKWTKPQAEPLKLSSPDRQDYLNLFERLVMYSVDADEDYVDRIPTPLALHMLNLVKQAPWPTGPRGNSMGEGYKRLRVIRRARRRKAELEDRGLSATDALDQAAEDVSQQSLLSASHIADLMQRKKPRR
jgi:hypothetical protein